MHERTALVTGASSGIGRAVAMRLAARGTNVVLCAPQREALDEVQAEISRLGGRAHVAPLDVAETSRVVSEVQRIDADLGGLDLVISSATVGGPLHGRNVTWHQIAPVLQANVLGGIATLTAAMPAMLARRRGHLVGITSIAGSRGLPTSAHYSASMAAVSTFLEGLRVDLDGTGVHVTDVRAGLPDDDGWAAFATPMLVRRETAVDEIVAAIDRHAAVASFPVVAAAALAASHLLPTSVYDRVVRRVSTA